MNHSNRLTKTMPIHYINPKAKLTGSLYSVLSLFFYLVVVVVFCHPANISVSMYIFVLFYLSFISCLCVNVLFFALMFILFNKKERESFIQKNYFTCSEFSQVKQ